MKLRYLIIMFVLVSYCSLLISNIIEVKQDGTGDFTTIQEGINTSVHYDTVLVYPGIYFENIDFDGKSITVASTYIIYEEDSLISQTIIDGNQEFRCVTIDGCSNVSLIGFTIQNGWAIIDSGYSDAGGGIFIIDSTVDIKHCLIQNNKSYYGGGISFWDADCLLSGNTIKFNYAIQGGGGLHERNPNGVLTYDDNNLNNIYLNYASSGSDITCSSNTFPNVIVDTFTTVNADYFYLTPVENFTFSALNNKIDFINSDLFVSPDGNDLNSGLSPDEPLQTISWAQTIIKSDSLYPNTIHLSEGIFSPSMNNQKFPLNIKNFITIQGAGKFSSVIDAEQLSPLIYYHMDAPELFTAMKGFTFTNGSIFLNGGGFISISRPFHHTELENILITNCIADEHNTVLLGKDGEYVLKNVDVINNYGSKAINLLAEFYENQYEHVDIYMENCKFIHNYPGESNWGSGGAINISGHIFDPGNYNTVFNNIEISDNFDDSINPGGLSGVIISKHMNATFINTTVGENITNDGKTVRITEKSSADFINSIIYNNEGSEVIVEDSSYVSFQNSLVQTGFDEIIVDETSSLDWITPNLDTDPLWLNEGDYPFALSDLSPCIDAGTLDLPEGIILPELDLSGNPRIYGEMIDIGAYEWNPDVSIDNDELIIIKKVTISNYPNPFNKSTKISFSILKNCVVNLSIFNIRGQKVKTLINENMQNCKHSIIWSGLNEQNQPVDSGIYLYKIKTENQETVKRMILLK